MGTLIRQRRLLSAAPVSRARGRDDRAGPSGLRRGRLAGAAALSESGLRLRQAELQ